MVYRIYPAELQHKDKKLFLTSHFETDNICSVELLQLNKANASDTEAAFLDFNLSIHNDTVSTEIYDKRDDFD